MAKAKMYGIPGSHAARTGELMLQHKGIDYERTDVFPGFHRIFVRLRGFKGDRVPAVRFADGRRGQGTRPLARTLDEIQPEPRLVSDDPRAEDAERWGDEVLQQWARRMVAGGGSRDPDLLEARGGEGRMGPLLTKRAAPRRTVSRAVLKAFKVTKEQLRDDEERVDEMLDRVDALIAEGVLNGAQLHAADFQIATSLALLDYRLDVRPRMEGRPLYGLVERVLPRSSG